MRLFIYFSEILGKPVLDEYNQTVGKLCDVSMRLNEEVFPKGEYAIISKGMCKKSYVKIDFQDFDMIEPTLRLKKKVSQNVEFVDKEIRPDFSLALDLLDKQVVDINDRKVVRVNDIHLLIVDNQPYLAHVDVGLRGLVRRLEWDKFVDGIVRMFDSKSPYLNEEELVSWKNAQMLTVGDKKNVLRLSVARKKLARIPPTELAEIMQDLDIFEKFSLFKSFSTDLQRKVFTDMAPNEKLELIDQLADKEAASLIENIPADEATDLLSNLPKEKTSKWLRLMHTKTTKRLKKLLGFAKDSAGGLMTTEYLYLSENATVKDAWEKIKGNVDYFGNIFYLYIVDEEHKLQGVTSLRRFLNVSTDTLLKDTCYPNKVFVRTDDGMEEVALLLEKYKYSSIPVLNEQDVLQGVITSDDILEELITLTWKKYRDQL